MELMGGSAEGTCRAMRCACRVPGACACVPALGVLGPAGTGSETHARFLPTCRLPPRSLGQGNAPEGKQKSLVDLLQKTTAEGKELSRNNSQHTNLAAAESGAGGGAEEGGSGSERQSSSGAAEASAGTSGTGDAHATPSTPAPAGSGAAAAGAGTPGAADRGAAGPAGSSGQPRTPAMLTISSQQALKYIRHYGQIMK